jgi:hypothetical protein
MNSILLLPSVLDKITMLHDVSVETDVQSQNCHAAANNWRGL